MLNSHINSVSMTTIVKPNFDFCLLHIFSQWVINSIIYGMENSHLGGCQNIKINRNIDLEIWSVISQTSHKYVGLMHDLQGTESGTVCDKHKYSTTTA